MAPRYAATAVFMLVVLASGLLHGRQTHRWTEKPKLDQYVDRLENIPVSFDSWSCEIAGSSDVNRFTGMKPKNKFEYEFDDNLKAHGIEGYTYRIYRNRNSTEVYQVLIVCGRGGPIASHTPDVCYRGSGYIPVGDQKRSDVAIPDSPKFYSLFQMKFRPPANRPTEAYMEKDIHWAWMPPAKGLQAPDAPRIVFSSLPVLYKVYIIYDRVAPPTTGTTATAAAPAPSPLTTSTTAAQHDSKKFLQAFLPRLEAALKDPAN